MQRFKTLTLTTLVSLTALATAFALSAHHKRASRPASLPNVTTADGRTLLPNGWRVTPTGRILALPGDLPQRMVVSPDGKYLAVNTGGYHNHSVSVIDIASEKITASLEVPKTWAGLCFDPESDDLYLSGAAGVSDPGRKPQKLDATPEMLTQMQQPVMRFAFAEGKLTLKDGIGIEGLAAKDRFTAGLAADKTDALYAVNIQTDTVYKLAGKPRKVAALVKVGYRPFGIAVSPDGQTVAVSNLGGASVSLLDAATLKETARVVVGSHPNELLYAPDGRLFVACGGTNSVQVVRDNQVIETINTALDPKAPMGSTPVSLALTKDGKRLYVANADNNDVAVINTGNAKESRVLGFIPTGWYPSAVAVSPDGKKLFVGTGKGLTSRANYPARTASPDTTYDQRNHYDYIGYILSGSVAVVDAPDAPKLAAYTRQCRANLPLPVASADKAHAADVTRSAFSKIKHVLFIIRENRTYDQVFGDLSGANGDPNLAIYGAKITPNAHALAKSTVILDNLYCNGEVSEDGHEWCNAAYATDFVEKAWPNNYSGRGEPEGDERISESPAGYLWDNCARHNLTYRTYGEFADFKSGPDTPPVFSGNPSLKDHACPNYSYLEKRDPQLADLFINELHQSEKSGQWWNYMVMSLGEDHTSGLKAGEYTPWSKVASNDVALGKIVSAVSRSKFWDETAIFIIEDDAQNGLDHVDAHRTVGLVISPYVKRGGFIDSSHYTTASMIRTMELMLKLPPMTQIDAHALPLYNAFTSRADLTPFDALPAQTDLEARNPKEGEGAKKSARLDFSRYDRADPALLNRILWEAARPGVPMPAPVRSANSLR